MWFLHKKRTKIENFLLLQEELNLVTISFNSRQALSQFLLLVHISRCGVGRGNRPLQMYFRLDIPI